MDTTTKLIVSKLNANQRDWFEERAAIMEYEGGHGRDSAELLAAARTLQHFKIKEEVMRAIVA